MPKRTARASDTSQAEPQSRPTSSRLNGELPPAELPARVPRPCSICTTFEIEPCVRKRKPHQALAFMSSTAGQESSKQGSISWHLLDPSSVLLGNKNRRSQPPQPLASIRSPNPTDIHRGTCVYGFPNRSFFFKKPCCEACTSCTLHGTRSARLSRSALPASYASREGEGCCCDSTTPPAAPALRMITLLLLRLLALLLHYYYGFCDDDY